MGLATHALFLTAGTAGRRGARNSGGPAGVSFGPSAAGTASEPASTIHTASVKRRVIERDSFAKSFGEAGRSGRTVSLEGILPDGKAWNYRGQELFHFRRKGRKGRKPCRR